MMRPRLRAPRVHRASEFFLCRPENLLLVKREADGGLLVCATAGNLTAEQQETFVRYLGAEGFLPEALKPPDRGHGQTADPEVQPVRWIVDPSWPQVDPVYARHSRRLCWCAVGAVMAWLALMGVLVWC